MAVLALALCLGGCSGAGPSGRDMLSAEGDANAKFALVEVNDQTINVVATWHRPSLSAVFGDYRQPAVQRIGIGDAVQINIWEAGGGIFTTTVIQGERNSPGSRGSTIPEQVVSRDGTINVPYAGRIKVAGRTITEVETQIVERLQGKSAQPQALVTMTKTASNAVTVTGDVTTGARVPLNPNGDRVLDVIAMAGGVRAPVHETFITLSRDGLSLNVPMQALLTNTRENVYVRPGDVITVVRSPQSFTAVGATGRQALVPFDAGGLTLEEALGKAGGLIDERADPHGVFVLRFEPTTLVRNYPKINPRLLGGDVVAVVYHLNFRDPTSLFYARRFAMRDKDILYVSHAPLSEVEKVTRLFTTLASPALSAYSISKITN